MLKKLLYAQFQFRNIWNDRSCLYVTLYLPHHNRIRVVLQAIDSISFPSFSSLLLWSPYGIGQAIIFSSCFFLSMFFFLFSSPILSRRILDVCYTTTHGVVLVRIKNAGLKCAARGSLKYRTQKIAISAPSHNFVGLYLRNEGIYRQSEKTS